MLLKDNFKCLLYRLIFVSLIESLGKRNLAENQLTCSVKDFTGRKLEFFMHIWAGPRDEKWKKGEIIIPFPLSAISPAISLGNLPLNSLLRVNSLRLQLNEE